MSVLLLPRWRKALVVAFPFLAVVGFVSSMRVETFAPLVLADEACYLGHARYLSGTGPHLSLLNTAFCHAGYSLLVTPAFWLARTPEGAHQAVLWLNVAMVASTYFSLLLFLDRTKLARPPESRMMAAVACLYPTFALQTNQAWAESAVVAGFTLVVALAADVWGRGTWPASLGFSLAAAGLYLVHPRMLPVTIMAGAFLISLMVLRRLSVGSGARALAAGAVVVAGTQLLHEHLFAVAWRRGVLLNPVRAVATVMRSPIELADDILGSGAGQVLYLVCTTGGLIVVAVFYLLQESWRLRRLPRESPLPVYAFLLLSAGGVLGSSMVVTRSARRLDMVFYGRYTEALLAPFLALALAAFFSWLPRASRTTALLRTQVLVITLASLGVVVTKSAFLGPGRPLARANVLGLEWLLRLSGDLDPALMAVVAALLSVLVLEAFRRRFALGVVALVFLFASTAWFGRELLARSHAGRRVLFEQVEAVRALGDVEAISWEKANGYPLFFDFQYLLPGIRFDLFDDKEGEIPAAQLVVARGDWELAPQLGAVELMPDEGAGALWRLPVGAPVPSSFLDARLGAEPVPGVAESGFYPSRNDRRWTNGVARLVVPLPQGSPRPVALRIDVTGGWRGTPLVVIVNGEICWDGLVEKSMRIEAPLGERELGPAVRIDLLSRVFVPREVDAESPDRRKLGVVVRGLWLLSEGVDS